MLKALKEREDESNRLRRLIVNGEVAERPHAGHAEQAAAGVGGALQRLARQVLKKLLAGPLLFTPRDEYFEFEAEGTFAKVLSDVANQFRWRPARDSVPLARVEDAPRKPEDRWGKPDSELGIWRP